VEKEENSLKAWLIKSKKKAKKEIEKCSDRCDNKMKGMIVNEINIYLLEIGENYLLYW
jgi:hypothetical protein